ncbi:hypothetical protein K7432_016428 [Basidiobolus ranarum]|uniref:Probable DNA polymerase n=1 Tax=Basidiobolus ranarum TaxID=34480 RepID=A0ABR2WEQ9_9FUNG
MGDDIWAQNLPNYTPPPLPIHQFNDIYIYVVGKTVQGPTKFNFKLKEGCFPPVTDSDFIDNVNEACQMISNMNTYTITNVTLGFVSDFNKTSFLSIKMHKILQKGRKYIFDKIANHEQGLGEELFPGSDGAGDIVNTCALNYGLFTIHTKKILSGGCKNIHKNVISSKCFDILDMSSNTNNNDCFFDALSYFLGPLDIKRLREHVKNYNGPISIKDVFYIERFLKVKINVYADELVPGSRKNQFIPKLLRGVGKSPISLLLLDELYYVITGRTKLRLFDYQNPNPNYGEDDEVPLNNLKGIEQRFYYFFDFETVWHKDTMEMLPYAYSITVTNENGEIVDEKFKMGDPNIHDVEGELMNYLESIGTQKKIVNYLIGYNNSKFDNYLLINAAHKHNCWHRGEIFANNAILFTSVLGFRVKDLFRFLRRKLAKVAEEFNCATKKEDFNHAKVQSAYLEGNILAFLEKNKNKIKKYTTSDTKILAKVYHKVRNIFFNILKMDIDKELTLPSLAYKSLKNHIDVTEDVQKLLPILNPKQDLAI